MVGGIPQSLKSAVRIVPRVGIQRLYRFFTAELSLSTRVLVGDFVRTWLAMAKTAFVGNLSFLAVIAGPFSITLLAMSDGGGEMIMS